jgi:dolichol-phosphate mannosyltransferase
MWSSRLIDRLRQAKRAWESRMPERAYLLQFAAVGASGFVVDTLTFLLLLPLMPAAPARGLAITTAMSWNYVGNRRLTFAGLATHGWLVSYIRYCLSCLAGAAVNWCVSVALISSIPLLRSHAWLAVAAGVLAGMAFNYLMCRRLVFRRSIQRETAVTVPSPSVRLPDSQTTPAPRSVPFRRAG